MDECQKSFQTLKNWLILTPILTLPEGNDRFIVYCDASKIGLGCVLMHHSKVIAYALRKLKLHKKNYPTYDLELTFVVFVLKIWCYNMYGVHMDVFTYHKRL